MPNVTRLDFTGQRFGRLTVLSEAPAKTRPGRRQVYILRRWNVRCDCGCEKVVSQASLRAGTSSCGCLWKERVEETAVKHGEARKGAVSREFTIWASMIQRCEDPRSRSYARYGGRGIAVCSRWREFANFFADMGRRPTERHTLDRIDNDGPYCPENCRWATTKEQANNRRSSLYVEHGGLRLTVAQWSERTGINYGTLISRIRRDWSIMDALTTPVRRESHHQSGRSRLLSL